MSSSEFTDSPVARGINPNRPYIRFGDYYHFTEGLGSFHDSLRFGKATTLWWQISDERTMSYRGGIPTPQLTQSSFVELNIYITGMDRVCSLDLYTRDCRLDIDRTPSWSFRGFAHNAAPRLGRDSSKLVGFIDVGPNCGQIKSVWLQVISGNTQLQEPVGRTSIR